MFRDQSEALRRIQAELLAEEPDAPEVEIRNFSNGYGKHPKVKNTDKADVDIKKYSKTVQKADKSISVMTRILIALTVLILGVLAAVLLRYWGVL